MDLATAGTMDEGVRARLREGPVLLDLSAITFMDSSGVRVLDGLLRDAAEEGWNLLVARALSAPVEQVLDLTGVIAQLPFAGAEGAG
jgi:anti-anti-sigma factor